MKIQSLLILLPLISFFIFDGAFVAQVDGRMVVALTGGWKPIKNVNDLDVQEIGKFAISEHNKDTKSSLQFDNVVKGETQVVAGINYRLLVVAKDGSVTNNYEVEVWEKAWEGYKKLTSFKQV